MNNWLNYLDFRDDFESAMDSRFYTIEWLDSMVSSEHFKFWSNDTSAIIAKIKEYPTGALEVHGMLAAGDIGGIVELIPYAEAWGRDQGAIIGGISSHPAWSKIMKKHGYEPQQLVLCKEL